MITIEFPGMKPCAKARPRVTSKGTYMPPAYREWKRGFGVWCNEVTERAKWLAQWPIAEPMSVSVTYRTASGNMRPDVDNAAGAVLDALQDAGVIENDSQVRRLLVEVVKAKRADCGITVQIEVMG